ncbi:hypothetical protein DM860_018145 [Cuscuta australis]|uniref:RING-type E3 ubiquitin transferase n=1 Tax=Cuscuta australis TaxID=267555 RepID=A0A328DJX6_9ASTE|nr:hypothetical protein DM860_018145 [Cuscuta australis]
MADPSEAGGMLNDSTMLAITGKAMVVAVISLFFAVVCVFLFHLYTRWLHSRQRGGGGRRPTTAGRSHRIQEEERPALGRGLDPSVLKTIPVITFGAKEVKEEVECSVCLSLVCEGEKGKVLPQCSHWFHGDCIDMWFQSHSTCPLCRNPVSEIPAEGKSPVTGGSLLGPCLREPPRGPISTQIPCSSSSSSTSSRPEGSLVIDIPREIVGEDDEHKSSPMATRLKSFRRLLSMGKRAGPSSPTSHLDLEQGMKSQI